MNTDHEVIAAVIARNREAAANPEFEDTSRVHNWRTYVSPEIKAAWPALCVETRCFIVELAESAADREEWD